ncbi:class I SAM-dependent DNA methyltransferase [Pseudotabrizicola alkalilacus]|uniref:site-specific DNA-methyltransferase (adenine-specific) n=1 Tax=Pseudotabrizicola alkalilacus TaxID=2305252 RepID=A0A411Z3U2_9RHOB|nr:DNA methyltransferase [Pseudotabrizicola alkalilacus]RGP37733.1 class I SAM-dependent DNA methyltransferase [Pseudotabrizicola alkalilacus]
MTPQEFIAKWRTVELKERSASQSHFNDICRLLGVDDPITADKTGDAFCFEKGASKTSGGEGWADVWKRDCFAWEYKGKKKDLDKAFGQLLQYAIALENPPLLIVSDMDRIRIHTNWTNTVQKVYEITLDDLMDGAKRDLLRACFQNPEKLKPQKTRQVLTEEAAQRFALIAQRLRGRGHDAHVVAHFVNRLVFCMFAEDVNLLPDKMFERMIKVSRPKPETFAAQASKLFAAMRTGGDVGFEQVDWFNGGLFDTDEALPLTWEDLDDLTRATQLDWSDIDPSILGTLFERGLDPEKRSQLGAHYTDRDKIMQIVLPVVVQPLLAEWATIRDQMAALIDAVPVATKDKLLVGADLAARTRAFKRAEDLRQGFLDRLRDYRVLDPACGSGNFLYIALTELKNIEHRANLEAEALGLQRPALLVVGPENVLGIELNPYAAELARVSVWIGEIQWMRRNGFEAARNPILRTLTTIENRDAVLNPDGSRAEWPKADAVVGKPPFLGNKKMIAGLGEAYTVALRKAWEIVPGGVDLVAYWFAKAWAQMQAGELTRAGLVTTNGIRAGATSQVLKPIVDKGRIFHAWSDEDWTINGAAVRVSMVCFDKENGQPAELDGAKVETIFSDLTAKTDGLDVSSATRLEENAAVSFQGVSKVGTFEIAGYDARNWLKAPLNPNGKPNAEVLRPWITGTDLTTRNRDEWVIDFGLNMPVEEAELFEAPFHAVATFVYPERQKSRRDAYRVKWWIHAEARPGMRKGIASFSRYIATPKVSKHRFFVFLPKVALASNLVIAVARSDDTTFGILSSRLHEIWSLALGQWIGVGNDPTYTPSTTFDTFPFPDGLTPNITAGDYANDPRAQKIAAAAARLNELRENWLNPSDLVDRVPEVVAGYPDRILPKNDAAAAELKKRTLTNLYNARPAWLDHAHRALDEAVAEAYGWGDDWRAGKLTDDEILARLFRLNQERAGKATA